MQETPDQLKELVDDPVERLDVEYKDWLDLVGENKHRADLARHIAAMANFGGGYVVIGIDDKTRKPTGPNRFPQVMYTNDLISGIVRKYLEPPLQCTVRPVTSLGGSVHPVVIVPGHGAAPICAKAGGPLDGGGQQGIVRDIYYVRKPGPESAPVLTAAEWAPIIRRCAMHEKASIMAAIDAALQGGGPERQDEDLLQKWHFACRKTFFSLPMPEHGFFHYSYSIGRADEETLDPGVLIETLRQVNAEIGDTVRTGWSIFYPFERTGIAPRFFTDPETGLGDTEFVQTALPLDPDGRRDSHYDTWRVAGAGLATIVRDYWEDDLGLNAWMGGKPGTWFSPNHLVMDLAEFVRHARAFSERFTSPTTVTFRCTWDNLLDRELKDPEALWRPGQIAVQDHRTSTGTWPAASLRDRWPEIVSRLTAPVMRLFGAEVELTPSWILGQTRKWRPMAES